VALYTDQVERSLSSAVRSNLSTALLIQRKGDDPSPTVTIAANVVERNADGRVRVAVLHGQIEVIDGAASVTRDDEPVMLRRPEPCGLFRG
jgi:hypothetical protein